MLIEEQVKINSGCLSVMNWTLIESSARGIMIADWEINLISELNLLNQAKTSARITYEINLMKFGKLIGNQINLLSIKQMKSTSLPQMKIDWIWFVD